MSHLQQTSDLYERTQQLIGSALNEVEQIFADEVTSENPYVRDIFQHTSRFRGKRLRPILCLLSAEACGGIQRPHLILSAVIEMIHTATLVHDDILDAAEVRRHVATVNVRWNNETSVLYGDYLFTHAFHLAASTGSAEACRMIGHSTNKVCEGELTQVRNRGNYSLTEREYFEIIDGKTGELCALAAEVGGKFNGASEETITALRVYGAELGRAFQIADDVLDLVGLENTVGKTLRTDLDQEKLTLPLIRLFQQLNDEERVQVSRWLEEKSETSQRELLTVVRQAGVIEESLAVARQHAEHGIAQLSCLPASPAKDILQQLPLLAIDRNC